MIGYFTAGNAGGTGGYIGEGITFPAKLPPAFNNEHVQYIESGDPFTNKCPGLNTAKRGWMCFYEGQSSGVDICCIYDRQYNSFATADHGTSASTGTSRRPATPTASGWCAPLDRTSGAGDPCGSPARIRRAARQPLSL